MSYRSLAVALIAIIAAMPSRPSGAETAPDWPTFGHDKSGQRFSAADQITPANVSQLKPAWIYHMKPEGAAVEQGFRPSGRSGAPARFASSEVTPVVVGGMLYITTPYHRVVALDPVTGKEIWVYDLPDNGQPDTHGVEYWAGSDADAPRIIFGTRGGELIELDAKSGKPIPGFGDTGILNTNTPEILNGFPNARNGYVSPPLVYKNLVLTGGLTQEYPTLGAAGDVRAWDVRTGKLVWTFHSVPHPGEKYHDTWPGDSWKGRSGTNVWGFMTVDEKRGIAYLPFGAPAYDRYGGDRPGDDLFDTSLVAVDVNTGKYLWHFQAVHHDIWDYDLESPPVLFDVKKGGKTIPAVAIVSKTALLFILNRVTGQPIYGVEERPVPPSDVPGEQASPTQPFPVKPAPLGRMSMSMADVATVTPELESYCRKFITDHNLLMSGPFQPVTYNRLRVQFPGTIGGANWGGMSYDPKLGYLFVNTQDLGQIEGFTDKPAAIPGAPARGFRSSDSNIPYVDMPGGGRFKEPLSNMMCQQPPWGSLYAVNVNTGGIAWRSTLGVTDSLPDDKKDTGRPNLGGSIATAGGLVFIGATDDARFRAFDAGTGKEVWTYHLGAAAIVVPSTYQGRDGKQYVVVASTGGGFTEAPLIDDSLTAFALDPGTTLVSMASPAPKAPVPTTTAPGGPALPAGPVPSGGMPPGPGHDLTVVKCSQCHDISVVSSERHTRQQWASIIDAMVERGMTASNDEINQIEDYLTAVRGPNP